MNTLVAGWLASFCSVYRKINRNSQLQVLVRILRWPGHRRPASLGPATGEILLNLVDDFLRVLPDWRAAARHGLLMLALAGLSMAASPSLAAQSPQDQDLPAEDIIAILQQNPELLAEAKAQIVAQLRDRGYPVTERSITDDRLFAEIRSDDRARHAMSDELKKRGFGAEDPAQPAAAQQQLAAQATTLTGNRPAPSNQPATATAASPPGPGPRGATRERATTQDQYPFRNLP